MTKEEAVSAMYDHLEVLEDYKVISNETAGTLYVYLSEIILSISEETDESNIIQILNNWDDFKKNTDRNDFGKPRGHN